MPGIRKLRKMQLGREGTAGTAVAAATVWRGPANSIEALDEIEFVEEDIGNLGGSNRSNKVSVGAQYAIPETAFTFEQFLHLCEMGIKTVSPSQDGTGDAYISTYPFPLTSANTIKTYTVEAGNNQDVDEMEYAFCPEFTVSGEPEAGVMMSGLLRGRQRTDASFTGALSVPSVEEANFGTAGLYLDAAGGSMGGTQITGAFMGFTINVNTGLVPIFTGDGNLYFYEEQQVGWEITADIVFRHTGDADTEDANWLAETARLLEIRLTGSAFDSAGDNYSNKTVKFQFPGKWENFGTLEDRDGNDILTGTFRAARDTTFGDGPKIIVVHDLDAIPG